MDLASAIARSLTPVPALIGDRNEQVLKAVDLSGLNGFEQTDFTPFDPRIKRTEAGSPFRPPPTLFWSADSADPVCCAVWLLELPDWRG